MAKASTLMVEEVKVNREACGNGGKIEVERSVGVMGNGEEQQGSG